MAAKVPDLGSDFAQKLLKDLRRRRERLGFESAAAQRGAANVAPRDAYSNSQKSLQIRNTQQHAAPRGGRAESTTNRLYRQGNNTPAAGARKPRSSHGAAPTAQSQAIVPFQGGGGSKPKPAANADVDMQMALALALSNRGKLQNIQLVESHSHGGKTNYLLSPSAHVGKVAIGVQKLNDILMAYTSAGAGGARGFRKRGSSVEVGKQLLRGAMDLEESLNMLMMLQDASDYMGMGGGSSGNGKVLLLEGKESRRRSCSSHSSTSARLVEIVDDEGSEAEPGSSDAEPDASMQIVPLRKFQDSTSANHRSGLQLTTSSKSSVNGDDSQGRMPNLIAKLMGLENLPSRKVVVEHKAAERFVRPDAVPRKAAAKNAATFGTLPIRIVGSEGVPSRGQQLKNFLSGEWNIRLTNKSEESRCATVLSNSRSDKQARQTMRQGLKENTERRVVSVTQAAHENIVHQGVKPTDEGKLQKTVGLGCRSDKKMNFLQRFRKSSKSKPVAAEKDAIQGSNKKLGKVQATGPKQPGADGEVKSRTARAKFNKENLSSAENKPELRNDKIDQPRSKQANKKVVDKRLQSHRQIQNEAASQILEHKRSMESEETHTKGKMGYGTPIQLKNGESTKEDHNAHRKPPYNTPSDDALFRQSAIEMKAISTAEKQFPPEIEDPATCVAQISASSIAKTTVDSMNQTASEAIQAVELFSEGQQQQQQTKDVCDPSRKDFDDHILKSDNPTDLQRHKIDAVSCDSFTETQLLLKEMLLKDHYLLETAKSITRNHVPVSSVHVDTGKWLDKGNKLLSDMGREVIRRKGKRIEAMADVSVARPATLRLQTLDDLVRELDADIQSLNIPNKRPHEQRDNSPAEHLKMVLCSDIENARADANSVWDFGWNCIRELPIEKNEVVKDLEKNILGGIITDVARELIDVSRCHGWCACEA